MLLVVVQHLPLPRIRFRSFFQLRRHRSFHLRQILYAVARERDSLSSRSCLHRNVISPSPQRISIHPEGLLFSPKIRVSNLQQTLRRKVRSSRSTSESPRYASIKIPALRIRTPYSRAFCLCAFRAAERTLLFSKQKIKDSHLYSKSQALGTSIRGDGWKKRMIRFSEHHSSITPVYRQPPSLTGICWLLLLGTERKLLRRSRGTAWQPSPGRFVRFFLSAR